MIRNNRKDGWIEVEHFGGPADGQKKYIDPGWRQTIARYGLPPWPDEITRGALPQDRLRIWDRAQFCEYKVVDVVIPNTEDCIRIAIAEGTSKGLAREKALTPYHNPQSSL